LWGKKNIGSVTTSSRKPLPKEKKKSVPRLVWGKEGEPVGKKNRLGAPFIGGEFKLENRLKGERDRIPRKTSIGRRYKAKVKKRNA